MINFSPVLVTFILALFFWGLVFLLHRVRQRISLIPLYGFISAFVVYTHTLSSFNINVVSGDLFFLVSSTVYFTSLLLGVLLIYLFDGVVAARKALEILIFVSLLQAIVVFTSALIDPNNLFIASEWANYNNYFWSLLAMIADIFLISLMWEFLSKIKSIPLVVKTTLALFVVFMADAFIFVTGVFAGSEIYWTIIKSDLVVRLGLSIMMGVVISIYLKQLNYKENLRDKPEHLWDILDFRSSMMLKLKGLEKEVQKRKKIEEELRQKTKSLEELNKMLSDIGKENEYIHKALSKVRAKAKED